MRPTFQNNEKRAGDETVDARRRWSEADEVPLRRFIDSGDETNRANHIKERSGGGHEDVEAQYCIGRVGEQLHHVDTQEATGADRVENPSREVAFRPVGKVIARGTKDEGDAAGEEKKGVKELPQARRLHSSGGRY